ncbi:bifunctional enoyl-CoA hydratase/phosphate acetyltransferase [Oceanithermus desulfurans]|uniref:Phosphate butyryltransferase n=2 Tax=Oceanithermus desulfurans TaxID=227924 RepID=A0A511RHB4_9DEIN|nr:bifunctional enoyl-CoA hydratase/phosphate acetyltransferase [Oceanithermus desulfurans]MBB6028972.1 phosphate butyryltransferase [Oceanithermus desulfurans]GEM89030.1 phosphate butyryltransferase [Oceanithermus desulfurans NBRC 100063]
MEALDFKEIQPLRDMTSLLELARLIAQVGGPKKVAVAAAEEAHVVEAVNEARIEGLVHPILFGNPERIRRIAGELGIRTQNLEIRHAKNPPEAAELATQAVSSGEADILMKGMVQSSDFLRAALNREWGLRTGRLLSHVLIYEAKGYDRLFFMSDGAMNINPDLKAKIQIVENAVTLAHVLGVNPPKVALLAAVEVVNPEMDTAVEDAIIAKMADRGQIKGAVIDGPLALDNAVSEEAARIKGIKSPVAGKADILIVDNIDVGNVFYKSLIYFARVRGAGLIMGARAPMVLTSRADPEEVKFLSLATAVIAAERLPYVHEAV